MTMATFQEYLIDAAFSGGLKNLLKDIRPVLEVPELFEFLRLQNSLLV